LPNGQIVKGVLHFYFDSDGKLQTLSEADYETSKDKLPELCFAIKCPIEKLNERDLFPDLKALVTKCIDFDAS
jgi:hypothetical protein